MNLKNIVWFKPLALLVNGLVATITLFIFILAFVDVPLFFKTPIEVWRFTQFYIMELLVAMFALGVTITAWFAIISPTSSRINIFRILIFILITFRLLMCVRIFLPMVSIPSEKDMFVNFAQKYAKYNQYPKIKEELDRIHEAFECCGPDKPVKITNDSYPISCCKVPIDDKCLQPYIHGCGPTIRKEFRIRNLIQTILSGFTVMEVVPYIYIRYGYKIEET